MGALVPGVHLAHRLVGLVDREHRAFGQDVQMHVGDHDGHLDDAVRVRLQAGHFHVDPDQIHFIWADWGCGCCYIGRL